MELNLIAPALYSEGLAAWHDHGHDGRYIHAQWRNFVVRVKWHGEGSTTEKRQAAMMAVMAMERLFRAEKRINATVREYWPGCKWNVERVIEALWWEGIQSPAWLESGEEVASDPCIEALARGLERDDERRADYLDAVKEFSEAWATIDSVDIDP